MIKARILISLTNGKEYVYVNPTVTDSNGVNEKYYAYTNEDGDKYANQTGAGKVAGDYATILTNAETAGWLVFPDGGTLITVKNREQPNSSKALIRTSIKTEQISDITVVEEQTDEWSDLQRERNLQY
ncbi:MAG: hypothetical protein ACOC1O_00975 [bacterium]